LSVSSLTRIRNIVGGDTDNGIRLILRTTEEGRRMNTGDIPSRWKIKIKEYLKSIGSEYESLGASDFPSDKEVEINFEDGSYAVFKYPLIIEAPEFEEVGIMTEHCGYFIFHEESITYKIRVAN
jgi:hypothetical protein